MVEIPSGFVQATIEYSGPTASGEAATVLGLTDGGETDLSVIANDIRTAWGDNMKALQHNSFRMERVRVVTETQEGASSTTFLSGERTGDLAPPNTSVLIRKLSNLRGRKHSGRSFLPGFLLDSDIFDDGTVNITPLQAISVAWNQVWTDLAAAGGYAQVILHNDVTTPTIVDAIRVEGRIATQRRRLR